MSTVQLWISGILAILRVLISQSTEDIVLSRIQELSFSPYLISCQAINRLRRGENNVSTPEDRAEVKQAKYLPEETFSRYVVLNNLSGRLRFLKSHKYINSSMYAQILHI